MKETFINEPEDMRWLRDVHLPGLSHSFKSAVIIGNEDYPSSIRVYLEREPAYDDPYWKLIRKGPGYMTEWVDPSGKRTNPVALEGRLAKKQGPFDIALKALPKYIVGYDALSHKTVSDLVFLARHELDLYEEGEDTDIRTLKQAAAVRAYIERFGTPGMFS
jgi:hypothetical protein